MNYELIILTVCDLHAVSVKPALTAHALLLMLTPDKDNTFYPTGVISLLLTKRDNIMLTCF